MKVHLHTQPVELDKHKFLVEENDLLVASDMLEAFPFLHDFLKSAKITISGCWLENNSKGKKYHLYRPEDGKTVCGRVIQPILKVKVIEAKSNDVCRTCAGKWYSSVYQEIRRSQTVVLNKEIE